MYVRPSAAPSVMQLIFWQRGFLQLILHYSQGNLGSPKMKVILSGTWSQILHSTINKLHRVQNNRPMQLGLCCRCRNELTRSLYSRNCIGCPSGEQHVSYEIAVLTFKIRSTSTPAYLNRHIHTRQRTRDTRSSATPALFEPFTRTNCAKRAFRCSASAVWNSLPRTVLDCVDLSTFKSKLKTFLFSHTFTYN